MAVLIVLSALSMAWFFSANTVALDGLNGLPDNVKTIVNDSQLFIGSVLLPCQILNVNYNVKCSSDKSQ